MYIKKTTVITYPLRVCEKRDEAYRQLAAVVVTNSAADYIGALRKIRRAERGCEQALEIQQHISDAYRYIGCGIGFDAAKLIVGQIVKEFEEQAIKKKSADRIRKEFEACTKMDSLLGFLSVLNAQAKSRYTRYNGVIKEQKREARKLEEFFNSDTFILYSFGSIEPDTIIERLREIAEKERYDDGYEDEDVEMEIDEEGIE